jgi:hypothetical protein
VKIRGAGSGGGGGNSALGEDSAATALNAEHEKFGNSTSKWRTTSIIDAALECDEALVLDFDAMKIDFGI